MSRSEDDEHGWVPAERTDEGVVVHDVHVTHRGVAPDGMAQLGDRVGAHRRGVGRRALPSTCDTGQELSGAAAGNTS